MLTIACLLSLVCTIKAIDRTSHYATVGVQVGATRQQQTYGPEIGINVGYALKRGHFLLHTGLEASFNYTFGSLADYTDSMAMVDTQNDPYTLRLAYSDIHTQNRSIRIGLPMRLGGQWRDFYFTIGPAFSLYAMHAQQRTFDVTSTADYDFLIDTFLDMPNHGLTARHVQDNWTSLPLTFGVDASVEIGWIVSSSTRRYFSRSPSFDCRLAVYSDIGLWRNTAFFIADAYSAGIRLSFWINPPHSFPCRCFNN